MVQDNLKRDLLIIIWADGGTYPVKKNEKSLGNIQN